MPRTSRRARRPRNLQRAIEEAKTRDSTARIQEAHVFLLHVLCEAMEDRLTAK